MQKIKNKKEQNKPSKNKSNITEFGRHFWSFKGREREEREAMTDEARIGKTE